MNGRTRQKYYAEIAQRDGEYCKGCGKLPSEGQLVINHRDNNNFNNILDNLQLLCRRCDYLKNSRQSLDNRVSESESEDETELQNNKKNEPLFRKYIYHMLGENGGKPLPEKDLINGAAEHVGNSPITCKRYLNKMCSSEGFLHRWRSVKTIVVGYKKESKFV